MASARAPGHAARGARTAGADPRPARVLEPGVRRLARHADPAPGIGNADRGGRRGVSLSVTAATACWTWAPAPAACCWPRCPSSRRRIRDRRGPLAGGRGAGRAQRRGAGIWRIARIRVRRLGRRAGRPVRPRPVQPALHPHRGPRQPDARGGAPRAAAALWTAAPDGFAAYRRLLPALPRLLAPTGVAVLELGAGQAETAAGLARQAGLAATSARSGRDSARPGAPAGAAMKKPFGSTGQADLACHLGRASRDSGLPQAPMAAMVGVLAGTSAVGLRPGRGGTTRDACGCARVSQQPPARNREGSTASI